METELDNRTRGLGRIAVAPMRRRDFIPNLRDEVLGSMLANVAIADELSVEFQCDRKSKFFTWVFMPRINQLLQEIAHILFRPIIPRIISEIARVTLVREDRAPIVWDVLSQEQAASVELHALSATG